VLYALNLAIEVVYFKVSRELKATKATPYTSSRMRCRGSDARSDGFERLFIGCKIGCKQLITKGIMRGSYE